MAMPLELIETEALKLTIEERSLLVERLIASMPQDEIDRAWAIEVARRDAEADANPSTLMPANEVIAEVRRAIA